MNIRLSQCFLTFRHRILKWEFTNAVDDDWGLNESRGAACEFIAWQFLCHLNQRETIEFLLEELPLPRRNSTNLFEMDRGSRAVPTRDIETTPLLSRSPTPLGLFGFGKRSSIVQTSQDRSTSMSASDEDVQKYAQYSRFFGLNALEIAAIAQAKRFLSQRVVQRVVNDIWNGEIVFWDSLTVHSTKKPRIFNKR